MPISKDKLAQIHTKTGLLLVNQHLNRHSAQSLTSRTAFPNTNNAGNVEVLQHFNNQHNTQQFSIKKK